MKEAPKRRRIVPQRVEPAEVLPCNDATRSNDAWQSPEGSRACLSHIDLREQARIAMEKLGARRRIFVDISKDPNVDWEKLCKASKVAIDAKAASTAAPQTQPDALPAIVEEVAPRRKNALNNVIQRLEQQFVMRDDDASGSEDNTPTEHVPESGNSSEDDGSGREGGPRGGQGGTSGEAAPPKPVKKKTADGTSGNGNAVGSIRDDQYDYEDNFIDDSEFVEYYAGDRRKAKHTGFFVNTGEIEKTGELIDGATQSPKKRKKKALPPPSAPSANAALPTASALQQEPQPKKAKTTKKQVAAPTMAPQTSKVMPAGNDVAGIAAMYDGGQPPTAAAAFTPSVAHSLPGVSGVTLALPAAPVVSSVPKKAARPATGSGPYEKSADILEAAAQLHRAAKAEPPSAEGATKRMPDSLRLVLQSFAGPYDREIKRHKDAQRTLNGELMEFLEPFTTRSNLGTILKKATDKLQRDYDCVKSRLRAGAEAKSTIAIASAEGQQRAADRFQWTADLKRDLYDFVQLRGQVKGQSQIKNGRIFSLLNNSFWPEGMFSDEEIATVYRSTSSSSAAAPAVSVPMPPLAAAGAAAKSAAKLTQAELEAIMLGSSGCRTMRPAVDAEPVTQSKQPVVPPTTAAAAPAVMLAPAAVPLPVDGTAPAVPTLAQLQVPPASHQLQGAVAAGGHQSPLQSTLSQLVALQPQPSPLPLQNRVPNPFVSHVHQHQQAPPVPQALSSAFPQTVVWQPSAAASSAVQSAGTDSAAPSSMAGDERSRGPQVAIDPAPHVEVGVSFGAPKELLLASVRAFGTSSIKGITNLMLMHAGASGFKVREVCEKVGELDLGDWLANRSKASSVSSAISKEPLIVGIGGHKYALAAFPNVVPVQPAPVVTASVATGAKPVAMPQPTSDTGVDGKAPAAAAV